MWRLRVRTQTQYCDEMHFSAFFISASQDGRIYAWEEISFYYIDLLAEKLENLTHMNSTYEFVPYFENIHTLFTLEILLIIASHSLYAKHT